VGGGDRPVTRKATPTSSVIPREPTDRPELVEVDPRSLIIGANVRAVPEPDKGLVASVRERGVLQAIVAYRDADGDLVVLRGQRRTLAAVEAGRPTVPVEVVSQPAEPDRLVDQLGENDHRQAIRPADRVAAYEQLGAFGLTAAQIAKRTATKRVEVDAALKVAGSETARKAAQRWGWLTLDQAAVVAEFDDDPAAVKDLVTAAKNGQLPHVAQRLRDDRADADAKAQAAAALAAAGVRVVDPPRYDDRSAARLSELVDAAAEVLTEPGHADCPGHAAYLHDVWDYGDDDDDESPATRTYQPVYVCTDYPTHGHRPRWRSTTRTPAAELSDADRAAASAQRRDVIASNKAWASATTVRREWLRTFVTRKTAPKTAVAFIAASMVAGDYALREALLSGHAFAHDLFGLEQPAGYASARTQVLAGLLDGVTDARAHMVTLALIVAAYEAATSTQSWRVVDASTARYLRYLEANGYTLSTVELRACGEQSPAGDGAGT